MQALILIFSLFFRTWSTVNYTNRLKGLQIEVEKAGASLGTILELETRLDQIEEQNSQKPGNSQNSRNSQKFREEMSRLQSLYRASFDPWVDTVSLKLIRTTEMEEL